MCHTWMRAPGGNTASHGSRLGPSRRGDPLGHCHCSDAAATPIAGWRRVVLWMVTLVSLALGLLANGGLPAPAPGASDPAQLESRVKAAFLPKLAAFVEWPASAFARPDSPIVLGILGDDPFGEEFEVALRAQKAQGRAFLLKRFREVAELTSCQMLFVSPAATARWPEIQALLKDAPTLTIGDADQFIENGGMINFVKEESKVRFQINMDASDRAGLKISVKLLQVSRVFRNGRWAK